MIALREQAQTMAKALESGNLTGYASALKAASKVKAASCSGGTSMRSMSPIILSPQRRQSIVER